MKEIIKTELDFLKSQKFYKQSTVDLLFKHFTGDLLLAALCQYGRQLLQAENEYLTKELQRKYPYGDMSIEGQLHE